MNESREFYLKVYGGFIKLNHVGEVESKVCEVEVVTCVHVAWQVNRVPYGVSVTP